MKKKQYRTATTANEYKIKINHDINPITKIISKLVVVSPIIFVFLVKSNSSQLQPFYTRFIYIATAVNP